MAANRDAAHQKPLNLVEIAKLAGSSKSAVSRVIQNQSGVAPEVRARIQHTIRVHHYRPSLFGRGLKGSRTGLIGVLGRFMESGFTAEVIRGIDDEVKRRGGHTLVSFAPGIEEYIAFWRSFVSGGQVDGVILIAPPVDLFNQSVGPSDRPTILCAAEPPKKATSWQRAGAVTVDNRSAMDRLVHHLVIKGYKRLAHLAGQPDIFDTQERVRCFEDAIRKHPGITGHVLQGAWTSELAREVVHEHLETHGTWPDAFLAFNDAIALGTLQTLQAMKIAVPDRIGVTGWDDIPFSDYAGLTTIHLPMHEMGIKTAEILYRLLEGKAGDLHAARRAKLEMPLKARRTTAREHS